MNIPKRASRHQAMRAWRRAGVSWVASWARAGWRRPAQQTISTRTPIRRSDMSSPPFIATLRNLSTRHRGKAPSVPTPSATRTPGTVRSISSSYLGLSPRWPVGIPVRLPALRLHLDTVPRRRRRQVAAVAHHHRMHEVLVQVIHVFHHAILERGADRDVVEHREVLHVLAQPHAAGVRADGDAELRGEQQHRQHLVDAAQPAAVDLTEPNRLRLHQLPAGRRQRGDRKSTRLNSSHSQISYAVFCLKKKKK